MKIAIFHELHFGGAKRAADEVSKVLKKKHIVDGYVIGNEKDSSESKYFTRLFSYRFIPRKYAGSDWKTRLYKDTIELIRLRSLHIRVANEMNHKGYDCVLVHPSQFTQAPFLLSFLNSPTIYFAHETLRMVYEPFLSGREELSIPKRLYECATRFIRKEIDRYNISFADAILTNSLFTKSNIEAAYRKKSNVCHFGVDDLFFRPKRLKKDIDILFIGSRDSVDGFDLLQDSLHVLSDIRLKVIDTFKSPVSDKELINTYNRANLVVCLSRSEPFGLIPLEAMACGVPVVAVNEGGYRETVINDKTGFLVARNSKKLAGAIDLLLSDKDLRTRFGLNARREVERRWTWERSANEIENQLRMVISV